MWPFKKKPKCPSRDAEYDAGIIHPEGWVNDEGCSTRHALRWSRYFNGWTIDRHNTNSTLDNARYPKEGTYGYEYARGMK